MKTRYLFLMLTALILKGTEAFGQTVQYTFTNFAGTPGIFGSADVTGSSARFGYPEGVAVDGAGNVYVADTWNHTIRKITPEGVVTTLAGSAEQRGSADGSGSAARFHNPWGVAVDSAGNVYVAEFSNNTIRKVTPAGVVTTLAGLSHDTNGDGYPDSGSADGTGSTALFANPTGVAVDSTGNVYVADSSNNTIREITPEGVVTTLAGLAGDNGYGSADGTGSTARFYGPSGVAVDSAGSVYVADIGNNTIRRITPVGAVTTLAGLAGDNGYPSVDGTGSTARFYGPSGVAVDSTGNVYVADSENCTIRKITPAATVNTLAGSAGLFGRADGTRTRAQFGFPNGVAVDSAGNVYVADSGNYTLRKITSDGAVTTLAGSARHFGSADGTGSAARFGHNTSGYTPGPTGVALDSAGNVYAADNGNHTIRKITPVGTNWLVTTLAGRVVTNEFGVPVGGYVDGTGNAARFNYPEGVAVDGAGNVYVADTRNHTIRSITPAGVVTTLAGNASVTNKFGPEGDFADGIGSAARFYSPEGVAVDRAGNVYVADTFNSMIRKITPGGVVTTLAGSTSEQGSTDGTGSEARFNNPRGVAVDSAGDLYVADRQNHTIRKITPVGTNWLVTTLARMVTNEFGIPVGGYADGASNTARFSYPSGVAVDSAGNVYVGDSYNNTIRKGYPAPMILSSVPGFGFNGGQFGFSLTGPAGQLAVVEASSDLVSWLPLWTNTFASALNFSDSQSGVFSNRFYRAALLSP